MNKLELIEKAYRDGQINSHKRDTLILALQKEDINVDRELRGLFENGYNTINKA